MKTAITILKNILLPKLEKDSSFESNKIDVPFWETFATALLDFETDAKPLYAVIYSLELVDAEKVISKLAGIYSKFLKELAETYVLGQFSEATNYLLKTNNDIFLQEVHFLQKMQQVIKSVERERIKADLPASFERLTFELSEIDLANASKKKGREDLRDKMKQWDKELVEEAVPIVTMLSNEKVKPKVISLSWLKYAAAACIIITAGALFFKYTQTDANRFSQPTENTVVTTDDKKETTVQQKNVPAKKAIVLAAIETVSEKTKVHQSESLGFSGAKKQQITINYKDASKRIASLEKFIDISETIDSKILSQYKAELASLKIQKNKYLFDGRELTLFMKNDIKGNSVLLMDDQSYFIKKGSIFYHLKISKVFLPLEKVSDEATIETLEKINFDNE